MKTPHAHVDSFHCQIADINTQAVETEQFYCPSVDNRPLEAKSTLYHVFPDVILQNEGLLLRDTPIQPTIAKLFPRLHLLGLPQELQYLIFDEVFEPRSRRHGATFLRPLLICRHVYHTFAVTAWRFSIFDLSSLSEEQLWRLKFTTPPAIASRKTAVTIVKAHQVREMVRLINILPHMVSLHILATVCSDATFQAEVMACVAAFMPCVKLLSKVKVFTASPSAFRDEVAQMLEFLALCATVTYGTGVPRDQRRSITISRKPKTADHPAHYLIAIGKPGLPVLRCLIFSDNFPHNGTLKTS